ncbi:hypothetical protein [Halobacteriovorax sp.]|uniref:hypothetical protein n=1 Tax=Halobacteriovorax sp. TaxID=2020862 RepID=UPI003AF28514
MKMKLGIRYYIFFIPTFVIFFIASAVLNFSTEEYICFFTAIAFAGLYCHPDRVSYFEGRTNRFNFANAVMSFFLNLEKRFPDNTWGNFFVRQIPGFLFFLLVSLTGVSIQGWLVYFGGVILFEITFFFYSKSVLNYVAKNSDEQIEQDDL